MSLFADAFKQLTSLQRDSNTWETGPMTLVKTAKRAKKRAAEKASIVDNHPTFNTPAFAVPGKDFNVLRHEDDVVTAAALFYFKGSHWREWQYFTLLAYIHVGGRVLNERENEGAVQKLVQLYELSLERRETLMTHHQHSLPSLFHRAHLLKVLLSLSSFQSSQQQFLTSLL